jgi:hypothetical protein
VNERATYEATLLRNRGVPSVIINLKEPPDAPGSSGGGTVDQAKRIKRKWQDEFTGDGRFTPLMSTLPIDVHDVAFSPNDMGTEKVAKLSIALVCGAMKLDPMVLHLPSEEKKFNNFKEAREMAYEECTIPTQQLIDEKDTLELLPQVLGSQPNDVIGRDYSQVRALQEDMDDLHKRWRDDWRSGGVKRKIFLARIGEEYDETLDDVYYTDLIPASGGGTGDSGPITDGQPSKTAEEILLHQAKGKLAQVFRARARKRKE